MNAILNISVYKFIDITDGPALKLAWQSLCDRFSVKGTILIAPEGVNIFLAAPRSAIESVLSNIKTDSRFADLEPKESFSQNQPFKKMRVRLKREIITMKMPDIRPSAARAPAVTAQQLKQWLDQGHDDQGRQIKLLDTRNAFEIDHGTFTGAIDYRIEKFSDFAQAVDAHKHDLQDKRIVTFCTGGIRCEKAAIYMQAQGIEAVTQLEGGILKYLEQVGHDHYQGTCFVFDERIAIDATAITTSANGKGQ